MRHNTIVVRVIEAPGGGTTRAMGSLKWWLAASLLVGVVGCGDQDVDKGPSLDTDGDDPGDDDDDDDDVEEKLDVGSNPEEPDPMEVCLEGEPSGERLALFDCEPCTESSGVGTAGPRWFVARVDVPSHPYRIDSIGAVVGGSAPVDLVYLVHDGMLPPPEPVFETIGTEVAGSSLHYFHSATLEEPIVIEESEHLFVGVYLEASGDTLFECSDTPDGDPQVWFRDDPPGEYPWQGLLDFTPQIYAYGAPG